MTREVCFNFAWHGQTCCVTLLDHVLSLEPADGQPFEQIVKGERIQIQPYLSGQARTAQFPDVISFLRMNTYSLATSSFLCTSTLLARVQNLQNQSRCASHFVQDRMSSIISKILPRKRRKRRRRRRRRKMRGTGILYCRKGLASIRQDPRFVNTLAIHQNSPTSTCLPSLQLPTQSSTLLNNMAQEYTYIPAFVTPPHRAPARSRFPSPEPAKEYYRYDAGNAGRLTSAPPKYQQAYVPATVCPANVVYLPVFFQTPNVPAHCVPAFYVDTLPIETRPAILLTHTSRPRIQIQLQSL